MSRAKLAGLRCALIGFFLILWQLVTGGIFPEFKLIDPVYVSSPTGIVASLYHDYPILLTDAVATLTAAFWGFVIGVIFGVSFGFLFARVPILSLLLDPFFLALNALPRPALAPLFIIWFGLGPTSKVILSVSIVFFLVFYNTYAGVRSIDENFILGVRVMGANRWHIMQFIVLPSVVSWVFAALRVGIAYSLLGVLVGELAGSTSGLGYRMNIARGLFQTDRLFAILTLLAVVGVVLTEGAKWLENRLQRWRPPVSGL